MKKVLITLIVTFAFCGSIFAQQYESHWPDVNAHLYQDQNPVVASVQIDGNFITGTDNYEAIEIAAFIDDEVRGHSFLVYNSSVMSYPYVQLDVQMHSPMLSPTEPDDKNKEITFKLFDHVNNWECDVFTSEPTVLAGYPYVNGYTGGDPVIISFFHTYTKEIIPYSGDGGYYFIASPIGEVQAKNVENLMSNNYDFYSFDQQEDLEWINHRGDKMT